MRAQEAARLKIGGNIRDRRRILHTCFKDLSGSIGVAMIGVASRARENELMGTTANEWKAPNQMHQRETKDSQVLLGIEGTGKRETMKHDLVRRGPTKHAWM